MITRFFGEYRWLSNFWPCKVVDKQGLEYPSTEHAYQAAKAADPAQRILYTTGTAGEAKRLGRKLQVRSDWDQIKLKVMEAVLRQKFAKGTKLAEKLIATGDQEIQEGNTWGDTYWGFCNGKGENNLGKLLMKIREELKQ